MEGGCWNIIYLRILGHIYWKTIILNIILIEILKFWHIFAHFCSKYGNFWKFIARFWGRFIIFRLRNGAYLFSICRITTPVQKAYIRCDLKVVFDFGDLWIHRSAMQQCCCLGSQLGRPVSLKSPALMLLFCLVWLKWRWTNLFWQSMVRILLLKTNIPLTQNHSIEVGAFIGMSLESLLISSYCRL